MNNTPITPDSLRVFLALARDADDWSGTPMIGGNVCHSKADLGNLTDLKKHGLLSTFESDGCYFVCFTDRGVAFAKSYGVQIPT